MLTTHFEFYYFTLLRFACILYHAHSEKYLNFKLIFIQIVFLYLCNICNLTLFVTS